MSKNVLLKTLLFIALTNGITACVSPVTRVISGDLRPQASEKIVFAYNASLDREMGEAVKKQFSDRRFTPVSVVEWSPHKEESADIVVEVSSQKAWDWAVYFKAVEINIYDAKTGGLIAVGRWESRHMHGYPSADEVAHELVNDIMAVLHLKGFDANPHRSDLP